MHDFLTKTRLMFQDRLLRKKVLFIAAFLVLFRLLAVIPIPGIDIARLQALLANNQFLGLLNIFSGGGLDNLSIVMLGVGPYITSSIIMQLMTMMSPKLCKRAKGTVSNLEYWLNFSLPASPSS